MKVDFSKFSVFTSFKKEAMVTINIKDELIDTLYKNVSGMAAHALTHKLYDAQGEVELTEAEVVIIDKLMAQSTGVMIDSWQFLKTEKA